MLRTGFIGLAAAWLLKILTFRLNPKILKSVDIYKSINRNYNIIMKIFRIPNAEKLGNFILTVITAFVSTFLMQSCMNLC